ncbi:hypothetical protein M3Y99_01719400 [Aphelenchoides fujianensis]|nr:hypothetical protein M3Y99_01719400 [Aphelenchoides fujianensis]
MERTRGVGRLETVRLSKCWSIRTGARTRKVRAPEPPQSAAGFHATVGHRPPSFPQAAQSVDFSRPVFLQSAPITPQSIQGHAARSEQQQEGEGGAEDVHSEEGVRVPTADHLAALRRRPSSRRFRRSRRRLRHLPRRSSKLRPPGVAGDRFRPAAPT